MSNARQNGRGGNTQGHSSSSASVNNGGGNRGGSAQSNKRPHPGSNGGGNNNHNSSSSSSNNRGGEYNNNNQRGGNTNGRPANNNNNNNNQGRNNNNNSNNNQGGNNNNNNNQGGNNNNNQGGGNQAGGPRKRKTYAKVQGKVKLVGYNDHTFYKKVPPSSIRIWDFTKQDENGLRATISRGDTRALCIRGPAMRASWGIKGNNFNADLSIDLGPKHVDYDKKTNKFDFSKCEPDVHPMFGDLNAKAEEFFNWTMKFSNEMMKKAKESKEECIYRHLVRTSDKSKKGESDIHYMFRAKLATKEYDNGDREFNTEFRAVDGFEDPLETVRPISRGAIIVPYLTIPSLYESSLCTIANPKIDRVDFLEMGGNPDDHDEDVVARFEDEEDAEDYAGMQNVFVGKARKRVKVDEEGGETATVAGDDRATIVPGAVGDEVDDEGDNEENQDYSDPGEEYADAN